MPTRAKDISFAIEYVKCKIDTFIVRTEDDFLTDKNGKVETQIIPLLSKEDKEKVSINVSYKAINAKGSTLFEIKILHEFRLITENKTKKRTQHILELAGQDALNELASIAHSTSRGILLEKLSNTIFNGFLIPIINFRQDWGQQQNI